MNESILNITNQSILTANALVNNIVIAIIIFFIGLIIGRVLGKIVERVLKEFKLDKTVKNKISLKSSLEKTIGIIVSYSFYFVFFIIALNYVGITSVLLNILSIIIVIVLAISTILAIKDSVPNFIAYKKISKQLKQGDAISIKEIEGNIEDITIFETIIKTNEEDILYIPNQLFLKEKYTKKKK